MQKKMLRGLKAQKKNNTEPNSYWKEKKIFKLRHKRHVLISKRHRKHRACSIFRSKRGLSNLIKRRRANRIRVRSILRKMRKHRKHKLHLLMRKHRRMLLKKKN